MGIQTTTRNYGTEKLGRLKKVLTHKPVESLKRIDSVNFKDFLFDAVPDVDKYLKEHEDYTNLLTSLGVEVFELSDHVKINKQLMKKLPNLAYMHDTAAITRQGAILSKMAFDGRKDEDVVVKEALSSLQIPIYYEFDAEDAFEGCLLLSPETVFIANTERHSKRSIEKVIPCILELFKEVIYVDIPQERRFMHPDMIYNRISPELALVFLPAFTRTRLISAEKQLEIDDFAQFMRSRDIELINISEEEQRRWGCTFVPLEPNVMIHYDIALDARTKQQLRRKGVDLIEFHPEALLAGGGSLRCLTLRLWRC